MARIERSLKSSAGQPSAEEVTMLRAELATTVRVVAVNGKSHVKSKSRKRKVQAVQKFDRELRCFAHHLESLGLSAPVLRLTEPCNGDGDVAETSPRPNAD